MVYCGKPSQACEPCRKRRIKCDKLEPSCSQCKRKSMQCSGYRNQLDLSFRDQTQAVVNKVTHDAKPPPRLDVVAKRSTSLDGIGDLSLYSSQSPPDFSMVISIPPQDIAFASFMEAYVPLSSFEYLPSVYKQNINSDAILYSTQAVALANLSRERRDGDLMQIARQFYSKALRQTKSALTTGEATSDATLASTLLLSLFESIALEGQVSMEKWNVHIQGALALLKVRGPASLENEAAKRMYMHIGQNIRVNCAQHGIPLPKALVALDKLAIPMLGQHLLMAMWPVLDGFIKLQVMESTPGLDTPLEMVTLALDLDAHAAATADVLPTELDFEAIAPEKAVEGTYYEGGGPVHRYPNSRTAKTWNSLRMTRLLLNEAIYQQSALAQYDPDISPPEEWGRSWEDLTAIAIENVRIMAKDILASVPQFVREPILNKQSKLNPLTMSGYIWPLTSVGRNAVVPMPARMYAAETLVMIGDGAALRAAAEIGAHMTDGCAVPFNWLHMFHLS
ncbi:hypothetical protein BT63DRAFT_419110 [Microthyrium microscopicum]|uniref:Zn(2)-C6 fungal-type domain-containing protein n=1 Tax=Microthyrium microscopicum TaxID=703497 RepID=A0A6A6TTA0_9PEZI|nr:hypothetical protein BT63DRAFT_419110 [Microthyrium microscopicum]